MSKNNSARMEKSEFAYPVAKLGSSLNGLAALLVLISLCGGAANADSPRITAAINLTG